MGKRIPIVAFILCIIILSVVFYWWYLIQQLRIRKKILIEENTDVKLDFNLSSNNLNMVTESLSASSSKVMAALIITHKKECMYFEVINRTICPTDNVTLEEIFEEIYLDQESSLGDFPLDITSFSFSSTPTEDELYTLTGGDIERARNFTDLKWIIDCNILIKGEYSKITFKTPYVLSNNRIDFQSDRKIKGFIVIGGADSTLRKVNDHRIFGNLAIGRNLDAGVLIEFE